jgi:hypothetical protein
MKRQPIQVSKRTWQIIRLEALRQTFKVGGAISMGNVIAKFAEKLNKKHKHIP